MKSYEHFIDLLLALLVIFLFPILFFGQKQDSLIQTIVKADTTRLVDQVRSKGYLTKDRYEQYLEELTSTNMLYEVSIEHRLQNYEPEYRYRTMEEILQQQNTSYTGSNIYVYRSVTTKAPVVIDSIDNSGLTMNTETNQSILAAAVDTPASTSHIHTDACYDGIKHIHTGNSTSGGGCYGSGTQISSSEYCGVYQDVDHIEYYKSWKCNKCGWTMSSWYTSPAYFICNMNGCNGTIEYQGYSASHTYYKCTGHCGTISLSQGTTHYKTVIGTTYSLNCGKTEGMYYKGSTRVDPICNQQIASIVATHQTQTVYLNDPFITTIIVTYRDGSTKTLVGTTIFSTANTVQNQAVTITYTTTVGGATVTKTCTITVTVIPKTKACVYNHTYNLNNDGSDPGCPYCRAWIKSLEISQPIASSITIFRGTTLPENGVTLLATYMDNRTEYMYSDYIDNLDKHYVGSQNVTLSYKGKYVTLMVITKRNIVQCDVCGRYFELYPDDTSPGCPYCAAETPIFTGNVMKYNDRIYTNDIIKELYEGRGTYYFNKNDYLVLTIENKSVSLGGRLLSNIYHGLGDIQLHIEYGGYIREEGRD